MIDVNQLVESLATALAAQVLAEAAVERTYSANQQADSELTTARHATNAAQRALVAALTPEVALAGETVRTASQINEMLGGAS